MYRCARGSTSLKSFHLHYNRFIPGTSASKGVSRWNVECASDAVSINLSSESKTYSGLLCQSVSELSDSVLGRKIKPNFQKIGKYTDNEGPDIIDAYLYLLQFTW